MRVREQMVKATPKQTTIPIPNASPTHVCILPFFTALVAAHNPIMENKSNPKPNVAVKLSSIIAVAMGMKKTKNRLGSCTLSYQLFSLYNIKDNLPVLGLDRRAS